MNGQDEQAAVYSRANDNAARAIAYFGPYLFWGAMTVVTSAVFLLA